MPHQSLLQTSFRFGYGDGWFNPAEKIAEQRIKCEFSRATRIPESFRDECIRTARLVAEQAKQRSTVPVLMLSGGQDSEVMVKSFIEAGVDFELRTFRFMHQTNGHEIHFVNKFCLRHGVKTRYVDIDFTPWIRSSQAADLFDGSFSMFYEMLPHMHLMDHIWNEGGIPVLANGEVCLYKKPDKTWHYIEYEYDMAWYRHVLRRQKPAVAGFFQHTPEQVLSMLLEPKMKECGEGRNVIANATVETSRQIKYSVYRKYWPDLQPRMKYDGGEIARSLIRELTAERLALRQASYDDWWLCPYSTFVESLHP